MTNNKSKIKAISIAKIVGITAAILVLTIGLNIFKNGSFQNIVSSLNTKSLSDPLNIQYMRSQTYPGSEIKIEEKLSPGTNYARYVVSFKSDGLKEFALMTIPDGNVPGEGFPVIILNHGYIIPEKYTPDGNYVAYVDALSKAGYIVFKPNYRGNGKSEGSPGSSYFSSNYAIDVLNAISSIERFAKVNPEKIGIWGHSMGGNISLRASEISPDVKAIVIWGGVVGDYNDLIYNWQNKVSYKPDAEDLFLRNLGLSALLAKYGNPDQNPDFWNSADPVKNLKFINAPVQIHTGLKDTQVPPVFSKSLFKKLNAQKKYAEYFEYPGANHDIYESFDSAMQRSIKFFDRYLK